MLGHGPQHAGSIAARRTAAIPESRSARISMTFQYDDIIVGAGSAGAVLAARLSEDPTRQVLVLEAGPDFPTLESTPADIINGSSMSLNDHDWQFRANIHDGRRI